MFNLNDTNDINKFKKRLADSRKKKGLTQETLANRLNIGRTSVVAWEREDNDKLPSIDNVNRLCSILDIEPNYLFGVTDVDCTDVQAISNAIHLSEDSISSLISQSFANPFIDFLLKNQSFDEFMNKLKQICYYKMTQQEFESKFLPSTLKKINKAFNKLYQATFPLDMSSNTFANYLQTQLQYNNYSSYEEFAKDTLTDSQYLSFRIQYPELSSADDSEKYKLTVHFLAKICYDYAFNNAHTELSMNRIVMILSEVITNFIDNEIYKYNNGIYIMYPDK